MQDLSKEEPKAIIETWMDAKKRYEKEFGPGKYVDSRPIDPAPEPIGYLACRRCIQ